MNEIALGEYRMVVEELHAADYPDLFSVYRQIEQQYVFELFFQKTVKCIARLKQ